MSFAVGGEEVMEVDETCQDDSSKREDDLRLDLPKAKKETEGAKENHKEAELELENEREKMKEINERKLTKSPLDDSQQTAGEVNMESEDDEESQKDAKTDWTCEQKTTMEELRKESRKKLEDLERELLKTKKETEEERENHRKAKNDWEHERKELKKENKDLKDSLRREGKSKAGTSSPQDKENARLTLTLKWSEQPNLSKIKHPLESTLQTWFNNPSKIQSDCSVEKILKDGRAVISIKPAPVVTELQELSGQTLTVKGKDKPSVTVLHVSLTEPDQDEQHSNSAIDQSAPPPEPQQVKSVKISRPISTTGEKNDSCFVPVGCFWFVKETFEKDIKQIETDNKVKMDSEVKVTFKAANKDGDPENAVSDFTNLVQKHINGSNGSTFPLQSMDAVQWSDALKVLKEKDSNLLATLSSSKIILFGPRKGQDAFTRCLNAIQQPISHEDYRFPEEPSLPIKMTINDSLLDAEMTFEESHWKQTKTRFGAKMDSIRAKFGVDVKERATADDKVSVQAVAKSASGNKSMEIHAIRALLRLYQKAATLPQSLTQCLGRSWNGVKESEGASGGFGGNVQSADRFYDTSDTAVKGATAAGEDNCPICLGPFTDKAQLECKHEFCKDCLESSHASMGPICPVCRAVFGKLEGNQPDGSMTWKRERLSLPGFSGCGTIIIDYYIPGGTQTVKHPNPGKYYFSLSRKAYLPDNKEGEEVLKLLKRAFDQKLTFTVGTSRTTGADNQLTWNDIHHKTSMYGGPQSFGYPDPDYLRRVKEELKAKGIF